MDPLAPLVASLRAEGRLRVWSLVITAFGDLVQHRGGAISTARLGTLLGRIGVEPGALRTALSRLGSDGWVEREREGRTSICRLSQQGLLQFAPATSTIYAPPVCERVEHWTLTVRLDEAGLPQVRMVPAGAAAGESDCAVTGKLDRITPAFRAALLPRPHREALEVLARDLDCLPGVSDPLDAAAARLLLIHRWRRIVLRFDDPCPDLMPADLPLRNPRAAVARAYGALSGAAECWLDTAYPGMPAMPGDDESLAKRFGLNAKA